MKPFITNEYAEVYDEFARRGIAAIREYHLSNVIDKIKNMTIVDLIQQEKIVTRDLYRFTKDYYEYYINKIKGKEGEIRKNIVGKTIDFSSRNVITPSLKIKPYEVLVSYHSARELFKMEFVIFLKKLYKALYYNTFEIDGELFTDKIKIPRHMLDRLNKIKIKNSGRWFKKLLVTVVEELETGATSPKEITSNQEIIDDLEFLYDLFVYNVNKGIIKLYTFINRQPTLWHLSIMAYDVKINTDKNDYTLKIHPLIVEAYNADFDGDSFAEAIVAVELDNTIKIAIHHNLH
jgi:DNA-directed RNA polymerase beta' subunit